MARTLKDAAEQFLVRKVLEGALKRLEGVKHMQFLTGYKTYVVAVILLIIAALQSLGIPVPGFELAPGEALTMALGLVFARNGAKTEVKKIS